MTPIETVKYQNDYTGEMFDDYKECFDSEARVKTTPVLLLFLRVVGLEILLKPLTATLFMA